MSKICVRLTGAAVIGLWLSVLGCKKGADSGKAPDVAVRDENREAVRTAAKDQIIALRARWDQEFPTIVNDRHRPRNMIEILHRPLSELSTESITELIDYISNTEGGSVSRDDFNDTLGGALVVTCLERADKANLVRLLAWNCPEHIGLFLIEYSVVAWANPALEDPILLLVAAYRKSPTQENKNRVLGVIRRAFVKLPPTGEGPDEFVEQCEKWYIRNKDTLRLNPQHAYNQAVLASEVPLFFYTEKEGR